MYIIIGRPQHAVASTEIAQNRRFDVNLSKYCGSCSSMVLKLTWTLQKQHRIGHCYSRIQPTNISRNRSVTDTNFS